MAGLHNEQKTAIDGLPFSIRVHEPATQQRQPGDSERDRRGRPLAAHRTAELRRHDLMHATRSAA